MEFGMPGPAGDVWVDSAQVEAYVASLRAKEEISFPPKDYTTFTVAQVADVFQRHNKKEVEDMLKNLPIAAKALGEKAAREDLQNLCSDYTQSDYVDDTCMLVMAEQLALIIDLLGGKEHIPALLKPLEQLCGQDEKVIRDAAVETIKKVVAACDPKAVETDVFPLVVRLCTADWFTSRLPAPELIIHIYQLVGDKEKATLKTHFELLSKDDTPMVRRAACSVLELFAAKLPPNEVAGFVLPIIMTRKGDAEPSVRALAVTKAAELASSLPPMDLQACIVPIIFSSAADAVPQVRQAVAEQIADLCKTMGPDLTRNILLDVFIKLLKDQDASVRAAAAFCASDVAAQAGADRTKAKLMPLFSTIPQDTADVAASFGCCVLYLSRVLSKEDSQKLLIPLVLQLFASQNTELRLSILSRLAQVKDTLDLRPLADAIIDSLKVMADDPKWRVRLAAQRQIIVVANALGADFFQEKVLEFAMSFLTDHVCSLRETAILNILSLHQLYGFAWTKQYVMPHITKLVEESNYLHRVTALTAVKALTLPFGPQNTVELLLPLYTKLSQDSVSNVRMSVAKLSAILCVVLEKPIVQSHIKPVLEQLSKDEDKDVSYYAKKAMESLEAPLVTDQEKLKNMLTPMSMETC